MCCYVAYSYAALLTQVNRCSWQTRVATEVLDNAGAPNLKRSYLRPYRFLGIGASILAIAILMLFSYDVLSEHLIAVGKTANSAAPSTKAANTETPATPPAAPKAASTAELLPPTALPDLSKVFYVLGVLGAGSIIALLLKRHLEYRDKRTPAIRSLCLRLQGLEKEMTFAYHFPGENIGVYDVVVADFRNTVLENNVIAVLSPNEHAAVVAALHECEGAGTYLSAQSQGSKAYTKRSRLEMIEAAKRALITIYRARDVLKDRTELRWQSHPQNRGRWIPGSIIERQVFD
jgi:hypothetical protein